MRCLVMGWFYAMERGGAMMRHGRAAGFPPPMPMGEVSAQQTEGVINRRNQPPSPFSPVLPPQAGEEGAALFVEHQRHKPMRNTSPPAFTGEMSAKLTEGVKLAG